MDPVRGGVPGNFQPRSGRSPHLPWPFHIPRWRNTRSPLLVVALLITSAGWAQQGNLRVRRIVLDRDTVRLDSMSIEPGSLRLFRDSVAVDTALYRVDPWHALVIRRRNAPRDTLLAQYRAWPLLLAGPLRHKDPDKLIDRIPDRADPFKYVPGKEAQDPFGVTGLNKSGSISRGVLFGNNQDLSVNSALNLELSGKLTDRIGVLASVTDNNIPIQAGGNTAELQDFDRVFIKLFDDRQELIAGDLVLDRPPSHFLTYLKKTKGLAYSTKLGQDRGAHGTLALSAAISKGKFARNVIQGIEGVQGPYRLTADDGGLFIVVLSGTERVYVDGQLLNRGQENDYVIDYNTAEVTFTAKRLITKDRRIVVEFQYSDKNYARSLARVSSSWTLGRTELHADIYTEQDSRNQPLQQTLSDADKAVLAQAGDDPLAATTPGADSVAFSNDEVLYARRDSLGYFPVYVYSTSADSGHYRVAFSVVGTGKGDYIQQQFTPNGRVFQWLAPDTVNGLIVHRGNYAPVRVLIPPRSQQLIEVGASHRFSDRTQVWAQLAWSNDDRNTFSSKDDADDQGTALRVGAEHPFRLSATDSTLRLVIGTDNERLSKDFRTVERYRPVEFERNWNATNVVQDQDQLLSTLSATLQAGKRGNVKLSSSTFQITRRYSGYRQALTTDLRLGRNDVQFDGSVLTTSSNGIVTDFLRHKARLAHRFKKITVGVRDEQERNRFRSDTSGALINGSYQFLDWEAFVQSADSARLGYRFSGGQRYEQALDHGALTPSTEATSYAAGFDLHADPKKRVGLTFTYRRLRVLDSTLTAQKPEDTWLARLEHDLTALKGVITFNAFYEFGSGLEQKREFIYVEVPAGQGTYVWNDYNGNGIKELNEFEVANFGYEANYIRAYTQTNQYVRVFSNQLSTSMDLRPNVVWSEAKGLKGFLGKWSDMASFRTDRKTGSDRVESALNPFVLDETDTALTSFSASLRNTVYYDRSGRKWSVDHSRQSDRNRSLLLNGFESRQRDSDILHVRWSVTPQWTFETEGETGRSTSRSDLLEGRTYAIDIRAARPKLTWQPNTSMRASVLLKYTDKKNRAELGGEHADIRDLGVEWRYNSSGKGSFQVNGDLVDIGYNGVANTSLGNEMLGGLKPGTNVTWGVTIQRRLSDHLQVDLTYNGRRSEGTPVVHVGGAQVRAYF